MISFSLTIDTPKMNSSGHAVSWTLGLPTRQSPLKESGNACELFDAYRAVL